MEYTKRICIFVLTTLITVEQVLSGQCQGSGGVISDGEERPITKGMQPLYTLTNGFLDTVHTESSGDIVEALGGKDDPFDYFEYVGDEWKTVASYYRGYFACMVVGLLFIVVFPFIGLIFCCCRCCCNNCGGKVAPNGKRDGCKRVVCGIFLALFTTIMLLGMVGAFMTNEMMREQTCSGSACEHKFTSTLDCGVAELVRYKDNTVGELRELKGVLRDQLGDINSTLYGIPQNAIMEIGKLIDSEAIFNRAQRLSDSVVRINSSLHVVVDLTDRLVVQGNELQKQFDQVKKDLDSAEVNATTIDPDYTMLPNVSNQETRVKDVLDSDLGNLIVNANDSFGNITLTVEDQIKDGLTEADEAIQSIITETDQAYDDFEFEVDDIMTQVNETSRKVKEQEATIELYGDYRYYACIGLSCLVLLVVLFYYLGLGFGACGEAPDEDAPCCNRGVGGTILMFGVAFTFLFWWLLMIVLLCLFFTGGIAYTEFCRPVQTLDNTGFLPVVDRLLSIDKENYSVVQVLSDCKVNTSIYTTLKLESYINLSELLDLDRYNIRSEISVIEDEAGDVDLTDVEIIGPEMQSALDNLNAVELDSIDFEAFDSELNKNITSTDLTDLIATLEAAGKNVTQLREIENTILPDMRTTTMLLKNAVNTLKQDILNGSAGSNFSLHVTGLMHALRSAQDTVHLNGSGVIQEFAASLGNTLYESLNTGTSILLSKLTNDVGRCGPVYNAVDIVVNEGLCTDVLNPFNGFWFSIGCCVFFALPAMILAVCLSGNYRKPYEYADNKTFDDPNYDAYAGPYPGDNIPLEDVQRGKARGGGGRGQNNTGYEREDYSQSRYHDPPRDYDDNSGYRQGGGGDAGGNSGYGGGGGRDVPRSAAGNGFNYSSTSMPYAPPHYNNNPRNY